LGCLGGPLNYRKEFSVYGNIVGQNPIKFPQKFGDFLLEEEVWNRNFIIRIFYKELIKKTIGILYFLGFFFEE